MRIIYMHSEGSVRASRSPPARTQVHDIDVSQVQIKTQNCEKVWSYCDGAAFEDSILFDPILIAGSRTCDVVKRVSVGALQKSLSYFLSCF